MEGWGRCEDGEGVRMGKVEKVEGWEGGRMGREANMLIIYIRVTLPAE